MDQLTRSRRQARCRRRMKALGLCIVALECSQILYHALARPDVSGNLARTLVASATVASPDADLSAG